MDALQIPVSFGEIVDKITILEIKAERIGDDGKLGNIRRELETLRRIWSQHQAGRDGELGTLTSRLKDVNTRLWLVEDDLRECERQQDFGDTFVRLARLVYKTNDERASIKSEINDLLDSPLREEKSYTSYGNV